MAYIYDDSQTYTGEIVNFTSTDKAKITSVSVPIAPTQDLHGYANPWPGGGGVNKIYFVGYSTDYYQPFSSVLQPVIDVDRQTITMNCAGSGQTVLLYKHDFPAGQYTVSFKNSAYAKRIIVRCFDANGTMLTSEDISVTNGVWNNFYQGWYINGVTFTIPNEADHFWLGLGVSGDVSNNEVVLSEIQLELGSTAHDWQPYSNICPISGLTGLSVYRTGKNLFDSDNLDTVSVSAGDRWGHKYTAAGTYAIKAYGVGANAYLYARVLNTDNTWSSNYYIVGNTTATAQIITITSGQTLCVFDAFEHTESQASDLFNNWKLQVALSSTQPDQYYPYEGNTYAVNWSTQAGTVYHGTVDVVTGQLAVDWVMVDLGSLTWYYNSTLYPTWPFFYAVVNEKKNGWNNGIMEAYRLTSGQYTRSEDFVFTCASYYSAKNVIIRDSRFTDPSAFKNAVTGQKYVYELATPLTYQLTPKQIAALTENYVWVSNGASITVVVSDVLHDFQGWLLKVGSDMTLVPTEMIKAETYKVSPNQRMEETAERDSTGVLWRETVPNMPPKIEFNTPAAYDTDVNALNAIFRAAYSNEQERKLTVAFYDPEENVYKSWECYMPNIDFPIRTIDIDAKTIFYDEIRYAFIGY